MAIPSTTIYICGGIRLTNTYDHSIYFQSANDQKTYFDSKVIKTFTDYVYIRKAWDLQVKAKMSEAVEWSYLFFINPGSSRRFYYFINDVEYVNDNTVTLKLEMDVLQTYLPYYVHNMCFVEREHSTSDNIGDNTVDENLETGEFVAPVSYSTAFNDYAVLLLTTFDIATTGYPSMLSSTHNGIFSGLAPFACTLNDAKNNLGEVLRLVDAAGKSDGIVAMWMYPRNLLTLAEGVSWSDGVIFKRLANCEIRSMTLSIPDTIDGYVPKNNKLFQYPYNFLYLTNNNGGSAVYKYEYFGIPGEVKFNYFGMISPEGIAAIYPLNYKGNANNYDEKLTLSGFPTCAWNSDVYKLWLAQTQNQRQADMIVNGVNIVGGAIATVGGIATGNLGVASAGAGVAIHNATAIYQNLAQKADKAITPPQAKGSQSGGLNMTVGEQEFTFYKKSVDAYHAKMIDDYFSMYGYAVKQVKVPKYNARPAWNYIKTVGSNVRISSTTGAIPVSDRNKINAIFDKGITFWKDGDKLGDYSQDNSL